MILDIHSHRVDFYPEGVECASVAAFRPLEGQSYSVGIHPWEASGVALPEALGVLGVLARRDDVVALGEAGLDALRGGPMWEQLRVFRAQAELAEEVGKPLVVHAVRTYDMVAAVRRDVGARQRWVVHGFRGKPGGAELLLRAGCDLSFGEWFNAETVRMVPRERFFAETDESGLGIEEIIGRLSVVRGEDMRFVVGDNVRGLLGD